MFITMEDDNNDYTEIKAPKDNVIKEDSNKMKSHSEDKLESLEEMFAFNLSTIAEISYEESSV